MCYTAGMSESDTREQIAEVLSDYRDGLLDSVEDGVERILEITGADRLVAVNRTVIGGGDDD